MSYGIGLGKAFFAKLDEQGNIIESIPFENVALNPSHVEGQVVSTQIESASISLTYDLTAAQMHQFKKVFGLYNHYIYPNWRRYGRKLEGVKR